MIYYCGYTTESLFSTAFVVYTRLNQDWFWWFQNLIVQDHHRIIESGHLALMGVYCNFIERNREINFKIKSGRLSAQSTKVDVSSPYEFDRRNHIISSRVRVLCETLQPSSKGFIHDQFLLLQHRM